MPYDRTTFQRLAELRLGEARVLLRENNPSGAYYLAGYAVECALKAIIATRFKEGQIPNKKFVDDIYTHDLNKLVRLAGLEADLTQSGVAFGKMWAVVEIWSEQARYEIWTFDVASAMIDAVGGSDAKEGVFQWLTNRW